MGAKTLFLLIKLLFVLINNTVHVWNKATLNVTSFLVKVIRVFLLLDVLEIGIFSFKQVQTEI